MTDVKKYEEQVKRAKEKLAQAKKKAKRQERKERDTALFTVGAIIFAALDNKEEYRRDEILDLWNYLENNYSPHVTDHRRKCLDKYFPN
jgi:hypothetical protein